MGRKRKPEYELPEKVKIVLECSPNLNPCEEFRDADIYRFAKHLNKRKCQQCIDFFVQSERELGTMRLLAAWWKSRDN